MSAPFEAGQSETFGIKEPSWGAFTPAKVSEPSWGAAPGMGVEA
ncbi:hypothetical protein ABT354_06370 [Streptomyces sp. NPDC000594]